MNNLTTPENTSGDETESIYSMQSYETELVQDTPDTDTKSEYSNSCDVEYEVADLSSEKENPLGEQESSSGTDRQTETSSLPLSNLLQENASGQGMEFTYTNFPICLQCKSPNTNPQLRYCQRCYQIRKNFFPPCPKGQKRRSEMERKNDASKRARAEDDNNNKSLDMDLVVEPEVQQKYLFGNRSLCIMCETELPNSVFVHVDTGCSLCCYKCAMRTWTTHTKCPGCTRKVKTILKMNTN